MRVSIVTVVIVVFAFTFHILALCQEPPKSSYSESIPYIPRRVVNEKGKELTEIISAPPFKLANNVSDFTIPVTVLNSEGKFIDGLTKGEFHLFIDDKPFEITNVETKKESLTVIFLLDTSPSASTKFTELKNLAARLVAKFQPGDRIGIAAFSRNLKFELLPTTDREKINKAINKLDMGDGTAIYDAIPSVFEKLSGLGTIPNAIVVLSDGVDTVSRKYTYQSSLATVERFSARVYPIYLNTYSAIPVNRSVTLPGGAVVNFPNNPSLKTRGESEKEYKFGRFYLTDLLSLSGGRPILADDVMSGKGISFDSIPYELSQQYYVSFRVENNDPLPARHSLKIRINRPDLVILSKASIVRP